MMNKAEVFDLLEQHQNPRGLAHWKSMKNTGGLDSFGIGLTQLRKLAKQIGKDHQLALELWNTNNHDAKLIGLLIDEAKKITEEQAEKQVEGLGIGMLSHVFSACGNTLVKTPFAHRLAEKWLDSKDSIRRRCAYGLYYELSKNKRNKSLTDEYFLNCIEQIRQNFVNESANTKASMGGALIGIGKRNLLLNAEAVKLAKTIGAIDFNEEGGKCEPMDVLKHITSDYVKNKLGIKQ